MNKLFPLFFLWMLSLPASAQKKYLPDSSINGISLADPSTVRKKFRGIRLPDYYEADHPPMLEFLNSSKTESLRIYHCYGSAKHSICMFSVQKAGREKTSRTILGDSRFISGRGIYLGMKLEDFRKRIGTKKMASKKMKDGVVRVELIVDGESDFLGRFNMPEYTGEYYFRNNRLEFMRFGFPNP